MLAYVEKKRRNSEEFDLLTYLKTPEVFEVKEGMVEALQGNGLGVEIDEERVREAARTPQQWRNPVWRGLDGGVREW